MWSDLNLRRGKNAHCPVVLALVDVINHFEFPAGEELLHQAQRIREPLAKLKLRARAAGVPVVYINDNFGQWRSNVQQLLAYCLRPQARGRAFVAALKPENDDYFILKPKHSAFYQTPFETLLRSLGASTIVFGGIATNSCILVSAHDASMRNIKVFIPRDCCAARSRKEHAEAIRHMHAMADAAISPSRSISFKKLICPKK